MARYIDHDKPLSEDDKTYLLTRSDGKYLIEINEARFEDLTEKEKDRKVSELDADREADADDEAAFQESLADAELPYDDDVIAKVEALEYNEIRQALSKANLDASGKREELEDRLLAHLQKEKDSSKTVPVVE